MAGSVGSWPPGEEQLRWGKVGFREFEGIVQESLKVEGALTADGSRGQGVTEQEPQLV